MYGIASGAIALRRRNSAGSMPISSAARSISRSVRYDASARPLPRNGHNGLVLVNTPVTSIHHLSNKVVVPTPQETLHAEYAVVTVSLGVLKSGAIQFNPPLPVAKTDAIARLGMSGMEKVVVTFDNVGNTSVFASH